MKTFRCACGARIFFENTRCLTCQRELGFLPDALALGSIEGNGSGSFVTPNGDFRKCANYVDEGVCNWMVPASASEGLCQACQLNHVIPNLSQPENRALWAEMEKAKRRLVYSLNQLKLPLCSKRDDPQAGLAFDIKADVGSTRVMTGHEDGLITLNLAEADAAEREKMRVAMKENYRTLLGHFRHEAGHYYWDRLVRGTTHLRRFRELFGDETASYGEALKRHYSDKPPQHNSELFISPYAAAHPWEDFAETFGHYLHMHDTLETAHDFGLTGQRLPGAGVEGDFERSVNEWTEMTIALNALNRSMGLPDAYPFAISAPVKAKLQFVHGLVTANEPAATAGQPVPQALARGLLEGPQ